MTEHRTNPLAVGALTAFLIATPLAGTCLAQATPDAGTATSSASTSTATSDQTQGHFDYGWLGLIGLLGLAGLMRGRSTTTTTDYRSTPPP